MPIFGGMVHVVVGMLANWSCCTLMKGLNVGLDFFGGGVFSGEAGIFLEAQETNNWR